MSNLPVHPCLALPFTVLSGPDRVRLVAGEDFRFTLAGPGIESWLPGWIASLDGRRSLEEALTQLAAEHHPAARQLVEQLSSERVLVSGPVAASHPAISYRIALEGAGAIREAMASFASAEGTEPRLAVLCQDRLDLDECVDSIRDPFCPVCRGCGFRARP